MFIKPRWEVHQVRWQCNRLVTKFVRHQREDDSFVTRLQHLITLVHQDDHLVVVHSCSNVAWQFGFTLALLFSPLPFCVVRIKLVDLLCNTDVEEVFHSTNNGSTGTVDELLHSWIFTAI